MQNKRTKANLRPATKSNRWIAKVNTDSTHPPAGLFTTDASTIAHALASHKVSPKGAGSGMRMLSYFINRAGKGLSRGRRAELERAKTLLSNLIANSDSGTRRRSPTRHKTK